MKKPRSFAGKRGKTTMYVTLKRHANIVIFSFLTSFFTFFDKKIKKTKKYFFIWKIRFIFAFGNEIPTDQAGSWKTKKHKIMKTVKVNNAKSYFKEIHKMQCGYKNETWADGDGFVYRDGKCVGRVVLEK